MQVGSRFGRYVITSHLGAGGMGTVYAAHDEELERGVALKVLHAAVSNDLGREARMLARVPHPNVVGVYDVGEHNGRQFISMEYVEGRTLRAWMKPSRSWSEVLRVLVPAARGLNAAHAAGVVHRDFKPENVLLSKDSRRVLVGDFGIAGLCTLDADGAGGASVGPTTSSMRVGSVSGGTPGYMAPEQSEGRAADARTDVFAYCTVLHEALYGTRPSRTARAPGRRVPRWLARAVACGLNTDPGERWASMGALLAHLERRQRVRRAAQFGAAGLALAVTVVGGVALAESWTAASCESSRPQMSEVWNATAQRRLRTVFAASDRPFAVGAADRAVAGLDAYAATWKGRRAQACAAQGLAAPHEDVHGCLDFAHLRVGALLELLTSSDVDTIAVSVDAIAGLPRPADCRQALLAVGNARFPQSTEAPSLVHQLQRGLADGQAALSAGQPERALAAARGLRADVPVRPGIDLAISGQLLAGRALHQLGRHEEASEELRAAFVAAQGTGSPRLALRAASQLTQLEGVQLADTKQGQLWSEIGRTMAERLPAQPDLAVGHLADRIGMFRAAKGEYAAALAAHAQAYGIAVRVVGPHHPSAIVALHNIGVAHSLMGNLDQALAVHTEALALQESALGPRHPSVGAALGSLGQVRIGLGEHRAARAYFERAIEIETEAHGEDASSIARDLDALARIESRLRRRDQARAMYRRALKIRRRGLGPDHPDVARSLHNIAGLDYEDRDFEASARGHERAVEILEKTHGPDHPDIAAMLSGVGAAYTALGRHEDALPIYERATAIVVEVFGPEHPNRAFLLHNRGVALQKLKRPQEAFETLSTAVSIAQAALGPRHPRVIELLRTFAVAHRRLGMMDAAAEFAEEAVSVAFANDIPAPVLARAEFTLAKALRDADADPRRATELALAAHHLFQSSTHEPQRREIEDWLNNKT